MVLLRKLKEALGFIDYKINDHYVPAIDYQKTYHLPVHIIAGPFKGVMFSFENVKWNRVVASIAINDGDMQPAGERLVATYDVIGLNSKAGVANKKKLTKVADEIWVDYATFIMDNHNKLKEQVLKDSTEEYPDEEYRDDNPEEFVGPRGVRKEGNSVSTARVRTRQKRTSTSGRDKGTLSKVQPTSD